MSEEHRAGVDRAGRARADVRQALLRSAFAHLYPGIAPGEWQPASVMANLVLSVRPGSRSNLALVDRDRVLDERHFQFRGLPSAGTQDDQRRSRLEDRRQRRAEAQ
jgi:hypothetical protein